MGAPGENLAPSPSRALGRDTEPLDDYPALHDFPAPAPKVQDIQALGDQPDSEANGTHAVAAKAPAKNVMPWQLFVYANTNVDKLMLAIGFLFAAGQGAMLPFFAVIFSDSMDVTVGQDGGSVEDKMRPTVQLMAALSVVMFVCGFIWQTALSWTGERQAARLRVTYFEKVLTQDISWFDCNDPAGLPSRMMSEVQLVHDAIGSKFGMVVQLVSQFVTGIVIAFAQGWELTLCMLTLVPFFGISGVLMAKDVAILTSEKQTWFAKAGAVAEEALYSIRTVAAFGGEKRELARFKAQLGPAKIGGTKAGVRMGISFGLMMALFAFGYAIAFWYGAHHLIATGRTNPVTGDPFNGSDVVLVFFSMLISVSAINDVSPPLMTVTQALMALSTINSAIESLARIEQDKRRDDPLPPALKDLERIDFRDVKFSFPSRQDVKVLRGATLSITKGQKAALVGESGSGKSTIIQLIERFYDPVGGQVLVNGVDLRQVPVAAWRNQIGYVGQEPVLFATSILENIKSNRPDITAEMAIEAAKQAQAFEFVDRLPQKFDTFVGVGGGQVSGGQKQRIAIARALARRPQLMLLDEATSALDNESEKQVQETIDRLQQDAGANLTTIAIAHRLSTVKNADVIFVMRMGVVREQGTHDELFAAQGEYWKLVQSQNTAGQDEPAAQRTDKKHESNEAEAAVKDDTAQHGEKDLARQVSPGSASEKSHKTATPEDPETQRAKELENYKTPIGRLLLMSKPEWILFPVAFLGALISGCNMPGQGWLFAEAMSDLYKMCDPPQPLDVCPDEMLDAMDRIIIAFVVLGFVCWFGDLLKHSLFAYIQESLTLRLREQSFEALVRQDIGFFDNPANSPSSLVSTLSRQCTLVSQMTGINFGNAAGSLLSVVAGVVMGFAGSWKLSLAIFAMMPFLMASMAIMFAMMLGTDGGGAAKKYSRSAEICTEAILNVRTVRALMAEGQCMTDYAKAVIEVSLKEARGAPKRGFAYGFGNAAIFTFYILGFGLGGRLIDEGLEPQKMYQSLMCIMFGAMGAAFAVAFTPDMVKGKQAAHDIFKIVDRESKVDAVNPVGQHQDLGDGSIVFEKVQFTFPHRPELKILRGLDFSVSRGQSVALVGPSGSGKSTVIQLLQRFYDPASGVIRVGGVPLTDFDISWWRKMVGFVGQEPLLFDMSLEDNVKYGKTDATRQEVEEAAKKANMDYVLNGKVSWTDGVGMKGSKLSGGQKQRCAIARAIVRNPAVLLLDEATSALDSASEQVVQAALDVARRGRTTFTIAHRLSTIRDSDIILVVAAGKIVERGTHDELIAMRGLYANLSHQGSH